MYGAILGDIIGEPYEFEQGPRSKDFPLFCERPVFTDDSLMTIAICQGVLEAGVDAGEDRMKESMITSMRRWGERHPLPAGGYGRGFARWLRSKNPEPYNSWGNGSAMRVAATGWLFDTLERTRQVARWSAEVTHNHPEGIKGAESVASVIWMARNGSPKDKIKSFVESEFNYDLSRTCDQIRPNYYHVESCQETVPEAITAFLEGDSFEDVIRNAVSLGGDCDTLTAIAGSIAEGRYGVSDELKQECRSRLNDDLREVLTRFENCLELS